MLTFSFFDRDPQQVAQDLLGKVIRVRQASHWLSAQIIETESYYLTEKGSHASLGYTHKRRALFMPAGTIYMYYARGDDSLNISCHGQGNAVLIKSAIPFIDERSPQSSLAIMLQNNPIKGSDRQRQTLRLCSGQTLLCRALGLKVKDWDAKQLDAQAFYFEDVGLAPQMLIQTTRLGIPAGRDEHLPYRFIDFEYVRYCTSNPLSKKNPPPYKIIQKCD